MNISFLILFIYSFIFLFLLIFFLFLYFLYVCMHVFILFYFYWIWTYTSTHITQYFYFAHTLFKAIIKKLMVSWCLLIQATLIETIKLSWRVYFIETRKLIRLRPSQLFFSLKASIQPIKLC